ncbi:hypothetical protein [Cryptosporangium phraense]|uniref:hypothetical protein n=1 Tax=Cryptosporangium phraense TaxID=2593070 RepID=UPI00197AF211|nr:hypothetical protein [Cryptosporangium phraense]
MHPVVDDQQLAVLRTLADRQSQLHQLLLLLIPGGAKKFLSEALLATVRPRDAAGKTRRRPA